MEPWMSGPAMKTVLTIVSTVLAYLLMTYVHVVLGEVVPKNAPIDKRERLAVLLAPPLLVFFHVAEPFVYVLEKSALILSKALGIQGVQHGGHSVEELKLILASSQREGVLQEFTEKSMQGLLEVEKYLTREIMVPRNQIVSVSADAGLDHILRIANEHQYTRLPIYETRPENLIGYLHVKDLLRDWEDRRLATERRRPVRPFELRKLLRTMPVAPESKPVSQLMAIFRESHTHMAMVVDEFGTTVGLVTLEDLMEQIFGEIEDEHDARRPHIEHGAEVLYLDGATPILDLELQYAIALPSEAEYETLAGFLLYKLGFIPKAGNHVEESGRRYIVDQMAGNRIARVRIERIGEDGGGGEVTAG
jgi:CBS domain containing-hemolysin-like protein